MSVYIVASDKITIYRLHARFIGSVALAQFHKATMSSACVAASHLLYEYDVH